MCTFTSHSSHSYLQNKIFTLLELVAADFRWKQWETKLMDHGDHELFSFVGILYHLKWNSPLGLLDQLSASPQLSLGMDSGLLVALTVSLMKEESHACCWVLMELSWKIAFSLWSGRHHSRIKAMDPCQQCLIFGGRYDDWMWSKVPVLDSEELRSVVSSSSSNALKSTSG